ncbi:uncharacterized protein PFL1_02745 [Pseudozyma flocculosa PF-1]|uniref:Uncharacterized protein n=2 Tax=Pseudozyma flocculosa TaxID=84751 RepID=A0A5C3F0W3_9BASI|nr:uncharacterized protein PFL1_02745 [Pseudozyma flocculosa PF-1]EPQ29526.1 hypothetical protein PFL1_02745 [Pseudozyma flocculosa PF-1]SPO38068.1 uncharacterized protein PSFLO_03545 [Pseudozyma flocculosa]
MRFVWQSSTRAHLPFAALLATLGAVVGVEPGQLHLPLNVDEVAQLWHGPVFVGGREPNAELLRSFRTEHPTPQPRLPHHDDTFDDLEPFHPLPPLSPERLNEPPEPVASSKERPGRTAPSTGSSSQGAAPLIQAAPKAPKRRARKIRLVPAATDSGTQHLETDIDRINNGPIRQGIRYRDGELAELTVRALKRRIIDAVGLHGAPEQPKVWIDPAPRKASLSRPKQTLILALFSAVDHQKKPKLGLMEDIMTDDYRVVFSHAAKTTVPDSSTFVFYAIAVPVKDFKDPTRAPSIMRTYLGKVYVQAPPHLLRPEGFSKNLNTRIRQAQQALNQESEAMHPGQTAAASAPAGTDHGAGQTRQPGKLTGFGLP